MTPSQSMSHPKGTWASWLEQNKSTWGRVCFHDCDWLNHLWCGQLSFGVKHGTGTLDQFFSIFNLPTSLRHCDGSLPGERWGPSWFRSAGFTVANRNNLGMPPTRTRKTSETYKGTKIHWGLTNFTTFQT